MGFWGLSDLPSKVSDTGQGLEGTGQATTTYIVQLHPQQQQQQTQAIFPVQLTHSQEAKVSAMSMTATPTSYPRESRTEKEAQPHWECGMQQID